MSGSNSRGYSFRISAEGMKEFAADMARLSGQVDGVHQAYGKLIQASPDLASSLLKAEDATKRAADRARELQQANERAAIAAQALPARMGAAAEGLDRLESRTKGARRALGDLRGTLELLGAGGAVGPLGAVSSQIGRIADAFGTASLAARAGTSALGMVVPVLGAVAAAAGGLYLAYQTLQRQAASYGTEQERLNRILGQTTEAQDLYRRAIDTTNDLVEDAEERSIRLANERRAEQRVTLELAAAEYELEAARLAARAANLPNSIAAAGEDAGAYAAMGFAGVSAAERQDALRYLQEQVRRTQELIAANAAGRAETQRRLEALGSGMVQYASPIGPALPREAAGRAGRADPIDGLAERVIARAAEAERREMERARELIARDEARALQERERAHERTTDNITRYLGDGFANAFREAGGGFDALLRSMRQTAMVAPIRIGIEAVMRPVVSSAVSGLGLANGAGGMMSSLGLGGIGAGVSGLLSTPLWGSTAAGAGMFAEAAPAAMGMSQAGGAAMAGLGPSLGATLGVAGLGAMGGGLLASMTGGNTTGGAIGGGAGSAAGFLLGSMTPLGPIGGALLGGLLGGAGGGMLGPRGNRPGFYNVGVTAGADGMLGIASAGEKRAGQQLAALQQQTAQQIAALNEQMAALGLRASGSVNLGANVSGANQVGGLGDVTTQIRLAAADARIQGAIDRAGGGTFAGQLGAAQSADALVKQIEAFAQAARDAADPLGAVARQFDGVRETAQRLGFGLDEVNRAQERAVREATARLVAPVSASLGGIADYARSLRTANDNTGNPLSRLAAAEAEFERLSAAARGGDVAAIGQFRQTAETFRGLSRQVFGTGQGFAANEGRIIAALEQIGSVSADTLTASALAAVQREQTDTLVTALAGVREEVARLRREVQQAQRNPLAA